MADFLTSPTISFAAADTAFSSRFELTPFSSSFHADAAIAAIFDIYCCFAFRAAAFADISFFFHEDTLLLLRHY